MVALGAALALSAVVIDVALGGDLGLFFDLCFVALCVTIALRVRPRDFFTVGVLPPLLMLGVFVLLDVARPEVLGHPQDGVVQSVVTGLAGHTRLTGCTGLSSYSGGSDLLVQPCEVLRNHRALAAQGL